MENDVSIEKLTRVYIKMRTKKEEMNREFEATISELEEKMKTVKSAILDHMKEIGAESLRTESGVVYRTVLTRYTTNDWDSMHKFILEHKVPEILVKALNQTNLKVFLEEHPEFIPPGLNANNEYSVTIKRSKNG